MTILDAIWVAGIVLFVAGTLAAVMLGVWAPMVERRLPRAVHMFSCALMGVRGYDVGTGNVRVYWLSLVAWTVFAAATAWMCVEIWRARRNRRGASAGQRGIIVSPSTAKQIRIENATVLVRTADATERTAEATERLANEAEHPTTRPS